MYISKKIYVRKLFLLEKSKNLFECLFWLKNILQMINELKAIIWLSLEFAFLGKLTFHERFPDPNWTLSLA